MTLKPWSLTQAWINSHWTPRLNPIDSKSSYNFSFRRRSGCRGSDRVRGGDDQANDDISDDEQDGEDGLSMEDQVAALVRAAQSDPENLSEWTREEMEKAEAEKREEEVVHLVTAPG